jgi:hypothetical protein
MHHPNQATFVNISGNIIHCYKRVKSGWRNGEKGAISPMPVPYIPLIPSKFSQHFFRCGGFVR